MDIAYGIKVKESGDHYISLVEEVIKGGSEAAIPGAFWVDFLPILAYVPSWFPGAGFQKKAAYWRELNTKMIEKPFLHVQEKLVRETFFFHELLMRHVYMTVLQKVDSISPSVASALIEQLPDENDPHRPMEERIAQDVATIAYIGLWSCK